MTEPMTAEDMRDIAADCIRQLELGIGPPATLTLGTNVMLALASIADRLEPEAVKGMPGLISTIEELGERLQSRPMYNPAQAVSLEEDMRLIQEILENARHRMLGIEIDAVFGKDVSHE